MRAMQVVTDIVLSSFLKGQTLNTNNQQLVLYAQNDSKTFVDQPLLASPTDVLAAFAALPPNSSATELAAFANRFFN
jgi:hypothetical protein